MSPAPIESSLPESATGASPSSHSVSANHKAENRRFFHLRGVQWRIDLGILPSSSQASVDDLRRVTADCRRRYAGLRRHLLVDPHNPKDGSNSPDMVMDNPLSQNPDSTWGRFFRNAELEKMVDQDLSRLYPERGSYFQTPGCQGMLRRILLLWCLRHPEYGYQQGMHELLAPLLYVLNIDLEHLSQVRKLYEDHFTDKFDGLSFNDSDLLYNFNLKKPPDSTEDEFGSHGNAAKIRSIDELDPQVQTIVLLSDAYGAEGELGIVLSEKFTEHDAYCMFDALMSGAHSAFALADFFSPFPAGGSHAGLPPVIEASTALYHLLSLVDSSLHTHLVELGVEPQYFSLRWLRVLFGREFSLEDLLVIWDEIFASENKKSDTCDVDDESSALWFLSTSRGAFISAIAVSMLLYLRSSLLATENATSCLQRLLNFPENVDLQKLIEKAKSLQTLALNAKFSSLPPSYGRVSNYSKSKVVRGHSNSFDAIMPNSPLNLVPESYWEEKWRVLHMEEQDKGGSRQQIAAPKRRWSDKVRFLSRTESDPFQVKPESDKKGTKSSVRRRLLQDLSHALGSEEDIDERRSNEVLDNNDNPSVEGDVDNRQDGSNKDSQYSTEKRDLNVNGGSEENSSLFSEPTSPLSGANDHENDSGSSSVASNLSLDQNDDPSRTVLNDSPLQASDQLENGMEKSGTNNDHENDSVRSSVASNLSLHQNDDPLRTIMDDSPLKASDQLENGMEKSGTNKDSVGISVIGTKDRKGKFQWFWKFGKNSAGEGTSDQGGAAWEAPISPVSKSNQGKNIVGSSTVDQSSRSYVSSKGDNVDQNVMVTLKNLGQSMLEHIQVIESAFQQERGQVASLENFSKNGLVGKGQVTATAALTELRKISNLLSEM